MKANRDERQRETAEWFDELEKYAKEKKLPMRIMDKLEECRKSALSGGADWGVISRSVEELLGSIAEKTAPTVVQEKTGSEASPEAVMAQLEKMARRCHTENMTSVNSMRERKNMAVKKLHGQLSEISHTKAHLDELKNEDLYLQFFTQCKVTYERDVFEMVRDLLQSISGNYTYMVDQMRSMFQSIGGYRNGIGNETFYLEYEGQKDGINKSVLAEAETADIGGSDIISFGQKTGDVVKSVVKKLVRKRKFLAWVPLLVLLCLLMTGVVVSHVQNRQESKRMEIADENEDAIVRDAARELGKMAIKKATPGVIKAVGGFFKSLFVSLGVFLVLVLMVIGLLYMCYLKILKHWCNRQIRKRCGEYLKTELSRFEQENGLSPKVDSVMQSAADEYERQYMEILHQMFAGTAYGAQDAQQGERAEWNALCDKWNALKYR